VADIYGVAPQDVASELPGLFPGGFDSLTIPAVATVVNWISTADTIVSLYVTDITGVNPAVTDKAAILAKRYIIEWVKGQVIRTVYTGNDIARVEAAAAPYAVSAQALLDALEQMGAQAVGIGEASPRVRVSALLPDRDLVLSDAMLDQGNERLRAF
jgi:hypothetical protein